MNKNEDKALLGACIVATAPTIAGIVTGQIPLDAGISLLLLEIGGALKAVLTGPTPGQ